MLRMPASLFEFNDPVIHDVAADIRITATVTHDVAATIRITAAVYRIIMTVISNIVILCEI